MKMEDFGTILGQSCKISTGIACEKSSIEELQVLNTNITKNI